MILFNNMKVKVCTIYPYLHAYKDRVKFNKKLILLISIALIIYFMFYCPLTQFTQEDLINALSRRNPPSWLVPSEPNETIDVELTENYKRQKLAVLKKKTDIFSLDIKNALAAEKRLNQEKDKDRSSWQKLRHDFSDIVSAFAEFWAITIVVNQNQEKVIVGESGQPINLNDRVLRWQKEIEASADKYQLEPALLAAVIEQESGGEPEALSPVGAIGLMQLMPSTAELMEVNPYDPAQNIEGGAHYLKLQIENFGDIRTALAAYNAGPGEVLNGSWIKIPETLNYVETVPVLILKYEQIWKENKNSPYFTKAL